MSTLGFDKYVEPLKLYLAKYRESVKGDKPVKGEGGAAASESKKGDGVITGVGDVLGVGALGMEPNVGAVGGGAPDMGMPSPLVSAYMAPPASEMAESGSGGVPMPALGLGMEPIADAPGPSDAALPTMPS